MSDRFTPAHRSSIMRAVRSRNTKPELRIRKLLHSLGYRFRLYVRDLPGSPDIVFRPRRRVIFVHGCFWHGHSDCKRAKLPASNSTFWAEKLARNMARDASAQAALQALGWSLHIVWECEISDVERLTKRLSEFLGPPRILPSTKQGEYPPRSDRT